MKPVVAYCRSACEPQRGSSNVHAQALAIRSHSNNRISLVYMDAGASGLTRERPALQWLPAGRRAGKIAMTVVEDPSACKATPAN
jgi:hypothetical protein